MGSSAHANALSQKHRLLDEEIQQELLKPNFDDMHIRKLKREKLKIKDEICRMGYQRA
ncbi:MAG: YdcH family protein [Hyphomicrobiaceae bacterium]